MFCRRIPALVMTVMLMLVPAVGRAKQHLDPPGAKPRLSAPYRSVDVKPARVLAVPDTSTRVRVPNDGGARPCRRADAAALPAAADVSDLDLLRGPPRP